MCTSLGTSLIVASLVLSALVPAEKKTPSGSEEIIVQAPTRSPDKHLRNWHEYRSEHFWVDSNLPNFVVSDLIHQLEKVRALELRQSLPRRRRLLTGRP